MDSPTREPGLEDGREIPLESSDGWPDLKGIHIMLIEDNDDTRLMVDEVLRHCGAVVTTYESAEVALVSFAGKGEASVVSGGTVSIVQV